MNPFTMLMEKDGDGRATTSLSMTRIVAFMFALTMCYALILMARGGHAHDLGWPFCALGIITLLAVPVQALFKLVNGWLQSRAGQALLGSFIAKVPALIAQIGAPKVNVEGPSTVNVVTPTKSAATPSIALLHEDESGA